MVRVNATKEHLLQMLMQFLALEKPELLEISCCERHLDLPQLNQPVQ